MKTAKTILCLILICMMLFTHACPVKAAPISNEAWEYITSSDLYSNGIYAVTKIHEHEDFIYTVPGTRAQHVAGATLTIGYSTAYSWTKESSKNFGCSASVSAGTTTGLSEVVVLTADYMFSATISGEYGLTESETCSIETSISYSLGENMAPGVYCIAMIFPGKTVTKSIIGKNLLGRENALWSEIIEYAPESDESYYTLWPCF